MQKLMIAIVIAALLLAFAGMMVSAQYVERDQGEITHQKRGRRIALLLVLALVVLELGLHFFYPNFRPETISQTIHYCCSFPTGLLLIAAIPFTGWRAARGAKWAKRWHKRFTRFRLPAWGFGATCVTGIAFIMLSLYLSQ